MRWCRARSWSFGEARRSSMVIPRVAVSSSKAASVGARRAKSTPSETAPAAPDSCQTLAKVSVSPLEDRTSWSGTHVPPPLSASLVVGAPSISIVTSKGSSVYTARPVFGSSATMVAPVVRGPDDGEASGLAEEGDRRAISASTVSPGAMRRDLGSPELGTPSLGRMPRTSSAPADSPSGPGVSITEKTRSRGSWPLLVTEIGKAEGWPRVISRGDESTPRPRSRSTNAASATGGEAAAALAALAPWAS
mmetsp:Transcript_6530/g.19690  ORF Transcript_6530/g.19690 Transcript_6530/m.19690 type:complete len:249 (+) Transcript_6530:1213-1959(+)